MSQSGNDLIVPPSRRATSFECYGKPPSAVTGNYYAVIDPEYIHLEANNAYCAAHGLDREGVIGRTVREIWGDTLFCSVFQHPLNRCLAGEEVHYDASFSFQLAGHRHFEVSMYPLGHNGAVTGAVVVTRDVTDKRRAEQEMHLMLELMRAVKDAPDFHSALTIALEKICNATGWAIGHAWIPDANGAQLESSYAAYANPELKDLLATGGAQRPGLTDGAGASRQPLRIIGSLCPSQCPDQSEAVVSGLKVAAAIPVIAGDDVVAVMEFFVAETERDDQQIMGMVTGVATQLGTVFQRKQAQEQLDRFFTRSLDMHCIAGFDGFLKRVNPAWEEAFGFTDDELLARPFLELVHRDEQPAVLAQFESLRLGFDVKAFAIRCACKDGSWKHTLWNATPLPNQQLIIATGRDITDARRAEEALRQSEEHYRDLFHQAYEMQLRLRHLSDRILQIQEQERTHLSRELHDEVGQSLTAVNVQLAMLKSALPGDSEAMLKRIADSQQILEQTMEAVHAIARDLRPAMLDDLGLLPALRSYTNAFARRTGIRTVFQASKAAEQLDRDCKTVIYRVVQEALTNTAKHSGASCANIRLRKRAGHICLEVVDNGRGFAGASGDCASGDGRLGLLGMQERVRLVDGQVAIRSEPGKGTAVEVTVSLK